MSDQPEHNPRRPVTWEEIRAIRTRFGEPEFIAPHFKRVKSPNGVKCEQLAREFHRVIPFIRQVVRKEIWIEGDKN